MAGGMADRGGQRAPGTVADKDQRGVAGQSDGTGGGKAIVIGSGVAVFGGKAVIDGDHAKTSCSANFGADVIMAFQPADNKAAAVEIDHGHGGSALGVGAAGDIGVGFIACGDARRIACVKGAAHLVVNRALLGDRHVDGVGGIEIRGLVDEVPGRAVDKLLVIGLRHDDEIPMAGEDRVLRRSERTKIERFLMLADRERGPAYGIDCATPTGFATAAKLGQGRARIARNCPKFRHERRLILPLTTSCVS